MRSFWSDPYLWIHLAGIAALPIWLELCFWGLAVGDPVLPVWLELLFVSVVGIVPILRMQWQRPFYIFSLVAVTLKPEQLTEDQRRLLKLFKAFRNRILAIAVAILLFIVLRQLYNAAPIAASAVPFPFSSRWLGLLVAAIAFLSSNLFLQVPVSVLSVMLTRESTFTATVPYPNEQIRQDFTLLGLRINRILPPVTPSVAQASTLAADIPESNTLKSDILKANISQSDSLDPDSLDAGTLKSDELGSDEVDSSEPASNALTESPVAAPASGALSDSAESSVEIASQEVEPGPGNLATSSSSEEPALEEPVNEPPT